MGQGWGIHCKMPAIPAIAHWTLRCLPCTGRNYCWIQESIEAELYSIADTGS
jgi:hypothetical protein